MSEIWKIHCRRERKGNEKRNRQETVEKMSNVQTTCLRTDISPEESMVRVQVGDRRIGVAPVRPVLRVVHQSARHHERRPLRRERTAPEGRLRLEHLGRSPDALLIVREVERVPLRGQDRDVVGLVVREHGKPGGGVVDVTSVVHCPQSLGLRIAVGIASTHCSAAVDVELVQRIDRDLYSLG
jgi:hypothetical protein